VSSTNISLIYLTPKKSNRYIIIVIKVKAQSDFTKDITRIIQGGLKRVQGTKTCASCVW